MWEIKRGNLSQRRHSDSSLLTTESRIPPLHDLAQVNEEEEEFDDDWFAKLASSNENSPKTITDGESRFPLLSADEPMRDRSLRLLLRLNKLRRRGSITITEADPTYKVAYLGNVLTGWAKGDGCVDKPLTTLWKNYTTSSKPDVQMKLTVTQSGLKAVTRDHGLTEYWAHRITHCVAPTNMPRVFCWVYRHEGRKLKQELRCHAVLCGKASTARRMASTLRLRLTQALSEFKRDKLLKQNARLSLANSVYDNPSLPRRKILLSTGSHNYKPPLERSKSAPKLMAIEEMLEEEDCVIKEEEDEEEEDTETVLMDVEGDQVDSAVKPRKIDIKITNLNFVKKLCSSIENLVETTSKRLGEGVVRRQSRDITPTTFKKPEDSILKWPTEEGAPEAAFRKPRKSVTFEDEETIKAVAVNFAKCTEYKKKEVEDESDESTNSLQSISSCSSEDREELSDAYNTKIHRLNSYLKNYDMELDSLSEDEEEEVVSDESGFVELDTALQRLGLDKKEKDTPFHKIIKADILRPRPLESSCLQV